MYVSRVYPSEGVSAFGWDGLVFEMAGGLSLKGLLKRFLEENLNPISEVESKTTGPAGGGRDSALVIDASGSMSDEDWPPSRLDAAKEASSVFCTRLAQEDPDARVTIIGYGSEARVLCPLTAAGEVAILRDAIHRIDYLGGTNIRAGLEKTAQLLRRSHGACDVVLLSDGHNTERSPKPVAADLKKRAAISCVGIGGSPEAVDEELLKWIASEHPDGSKRYRWIGDKERLVRHFHQLAGRITRG